MDFVNKVVRGEPLSPVLTGVGEGCERDPSRVHGSLCSCWSSCKRRAPVQAGKVDVGAGWEVRGAVPAEVAVAQTRVVAVGVTDVEGVWSPVSARAAGVTVSPRIRRSAQGRGARWRRGVPWPQAGRQAEEEPGCVLIRSNI